MKAIGFGIRVWGSSQRTCVCTAKTGREEQYIKKMKLNVVKAGLEERPLSTETQCSESPDAPKQKKQDCEQTKPTTLKSAP